MSRFLGIISGWLIALIFGIALFFAAQNVRNAAETNADLKSRLRLQQQENVNLRNYLVQYEQLSDSLLHAGTEVNMEVADRLGALREQFGL